MNFCIVLSSLLNVHLAPARAGREIGVDHLPRSVGPIAALGAGPNIAWIAERIDGRRDSGQDISKTRHLPCLSGLLPLKRADLAFHVLHLHLELSYLLA